MVKITKNINVKNKLSPTSELMWKNLPKYFQYCKYFLLYQVYMDIFYENVPSLPELEP